MKVDSSSIDREGDVSQSKFLLAVEPDEDRGVTMDVGLIYIHFLQRIEEDDIGGRAVINEYSLDFVVGYEQQDD